MHKNIAWLYNSEIFDRNIFLKKTMTGLKINLVIIVPVFNSYAIIHFTDFIIIHIILHIVRQMPAACLLVCIHMSIPLTSEMLDFSPPAAVCVCECV